MQTPKPNADTPAREVHSRRGISLLEVLLVVAMLGILAASAIPLLEPSLADQLESAAVIVVDDLEYARTLAVANNSKYQLIFSSRQSYYLEHSGNSTSALETLPSSAFREPTDPPNRQTTTFTRLPGLRDVRIVGACQVNGSLQTKVASIEFNPLGATASNRVSEVWLAAGEGTATRYLSIRVNAVTGLAQVGTINGKAPAFPANS